MPSGRITGFVPGAFVRRHDRMNGVPHGGTGAHAGARSVRGATLRARSLRTLLLGRIAAPMKRALYANEVAHRRPLLRRGDCVRNIVVAERPPCRSCLTSAYSSRPDDADDVAHHRSLTECFTIGVIALLESRVVCPRPRPATAGQGSAPCRPTSWRSSGRKIRRHFWKTGDGAILFPTRPSSPAFRRSTSKCSTSNRNKIDHRPNLLDVWSRTIQNQPEPAIHIFHYDLNPCEHPFAELQIITKLMFVEVYLILV